jgi:hypothetical protein
MEERETLRHQIATKRGPVYWSELKYFLAILVDGVTYWPDPVPDQKVDEEGFAAIELVNEV